MKSIFKHTLNSIRKNSGQTVVIILTVIIVTAFFFVSFLMSDVFYTANTAVYNRYGEGMDFLVEGEALSPSRIEDFSVKYPETVADTLYMYVQTGVFETDKVSKAVRIEALNLKSYYEKFPEKILRKESIGEASHEYPSVWIGEGFAKKCAISTGENVKLYLPSQNKYLTFSVTEIMYNEGAFGNTVNDNVIVDLSSLSLNGLVNTAYVRLMENADTETCREQLISHIDNESISVKDAIDYVEVERVVGNNTRLLNIALTFIITIMTVIMFTCFLVVTKNRINEMTVFKASGATAGQIVTILLFEVLVYGLIGSVIGIIVGRISMGLAVNSILPEFPDAIGYSAWKYFAALGLGLAVTLVSSLIPVLMVAKKTIRELESGTVKAVVYAKPWYVILTTCLVIFGIIAVVLWETYVVPITIALLVVFAFWLYGIIPYVIRFFSFILRKSKGMTCLATFSIKRNSSTMLLTTLVVAVITFSFVVVSIMGVVIVGLTAPATRFSGDYVVTSLAEEAPTEEILSAYRGLNGVSEAYAYKLQSYTTKVDDKLIEYDVIAVDSPDALKYMTKGLKQEELDYFSQNNRVAIISYDMSKRLNLKIGDEFSVQREIVGVSSTEIEALGNFTVAGIEYTQTSTDRVIFIKLTEFYANGKPAKALSGQFIILSDKTLSSGELFLKLRTLSKGYDKLFVLTFDSWLEANEKGYDGIASLLSLLRFMVILVALIGVINLTIVTVLDRRQEFGIYRISGMSPSLQRRLALREGGLIGISGAIVGFILCFIMNRLLSVFALLIDKYMRFGFFTFELGIISILGAFACFIIYFLVGVVYGNKKLTTLNIG